MKVVVLSTRLRRAASFADVLEHEPSIDLVMVVANATRRPLFRFLAAQLIDAAGVGPHRLLRMVQALVRHQLILTGRGLDDETVLARLRELHAEIGLHAAGVIYRRSLIDCFTKGILNAHIGLLPRYRGRSVVEWSILNGDPTGVTTFFIDEGIDTGERIVLRKAVDVSTYPDIGSAKAYLFSLDGQMFAEALRALAASGPLRRQEAKDGTRWYVMSHLLTSVVDDILGASPAARDDGGKHL